MHALFYLCCCCFSFLFPLSRKYWLTFPLLPLHKIHSLPPMSAFPGIYWNRLHHGFYFCLSDSKSSSEFSYHLLFPGSDPLIVWGSLCITSDYISYQSFISLKQTPNCFRLNLRIHCLSSEKSLITPGTFWEHALWLSLNLNLSFLTTVLYADFSYADHTGVVSYFNC